MGDAEIRAALQAENEALHQRMTTLETQYQALEQTLQRMQQAIAQAPAMVIALDPQGIVTLVAGQIASSMGRYPRVGQSALEYYQSYPNLVQALHQALQGATPAVCPTNQHGSIYEYHIAPLANEQQQPLGAVAIVIDSTSRTVITNQMLFARYALDNAPDTVLWGDSNGAITYANDAACRELGYTHEELRTMHIADINPDIPRETFGQMIEDMRQRGLTRMETWHQRKDGSRFPVDVSSTYLSLDGQDYLCAFVRDMTERQATEAELSIFKSVVETAPDGVSFVSPEGIITYGNAAMKAMLGYGSDYAGLPVAQAFGGDSEQPMRIIQHVLEHGDWQGRLTYYHKDGSPVQAHLSVFAIARDDGSVMTFPGFVRDLSEVLQAEAERAALQQQIIDAQQAALRELSTPLLPISDDTVVMPLVGTIDSMRAQQIMEALLEGIALYQTDTAILDITGVRVVDTQVAQALIRTAQAVKLLGARVVLTGIQPHLAQTLVHLGVDLGALITRSTLQAGIADALHAER